jgi:hypothetical protein
MLRSEKGQKIEVKNLCEKSKGLLVLKFDETTCGKCISSTFEDMSLLNIARFKNIIVIGNFSNIRSQKIFAKENKLGNIVYQIKPSSSCQELKNKSDAPVFYYLDEKGYVLHEVKNDEPSKIEEIKELIVAYGICSEEIDFKQL